MKSATDTYKWVRSYTSS